MFYEDDVDDIAPSLIPVREYFDDNSWASFILPNSFAGITDAAYGGVKPYNTPSLGETHGTFFLK